MKTYLALFLVAAFGSAVLTPLLRRFCERHRLVDASLDQRRIHQKAVPRLGGVAIFISVVIALSSLALVHNLLTQTLRTELKPILSVMICGLLVLGIGAYDDLRGANATIKFVSLSCVTTLFYTLGGRIEVESAPGEGTRVVGVCPLDGEFKEKGRRA